MTEEVSRKSGIVRFGMAFEAGTFLLAVLLGWLLGIPPIRQMHLDWSGVLAGAVATLPLLIGMWWCSKSQLGPLRRLTQEVEESLIPLFRDAAPLSLLLISVLAGLGEECLFRGVVQTGLTDWFGVPVAVVVTSALFGVAHLITPTYAVLAAIIGAYFSIMVLMTDNLLVPVLAHALYDYAALSYLVGSKRKGMREYADGASSSPPSSNGNNADLTAR